MLQQSWTLDFRRPPTHVLADVTSAWMLGLTAFDVEPLPGSSDDGTAEPKLPRYGSSHILAESCASPS